MQKINFQDLPSTATPINATNLNAIQTNAENDINTKVGDLTQLQTTSKTSAVSAINEIVNNTDDYIIDQGTTTVSSTTWTYTKWKSGRVDLYGSGSKTGMTIATASAGTYYGANAKLELTLPFALSSVLYIGVQETSPRSSGVWAYASTISGTTLTTEFRSFGAINSNGACGCSYHIVGTIS